MASIWVRQESPTPSDSATEPILSGSTVITVSPTGTTFQVNTSAATDRTSGFSGPSVSAPLSSSSPSAAGGNISRSQPIPLRTLIAVCVAAFILVGGIVLFVLWFGARSKRKPDTKSDGPSAGPTASHATTADEVGLKGLASSNATTVFPSLKNHKSNGSSIRYSQDARSLPRKSGGDSAFGHGRYASTEEHHQFSARPAMHRPSTGPRPGHERSDSFHPLQRSNTQPEDPDSYYNPSQFVDASIPRFSSPTGSAHAIVRPYVIGSHPYASPISTNSQLRSSNEHMGTPFNGIQSFDPESEAPRAIGSSHGSFAGAGSRPGYDAYGFDTRPGGLAERPSMDSIRNIAMNARNEDQAEFSKPAGSLAARSRKNSTSSSILRQLSPSAGPTRGPKDGAKEKLSKGEKMREMAAMEDLIAALDQSAQLERNRKAGLAAAAGLDQDEPYSSYRRRDPEITGSYPLPPPEVFRKALSTQASDDEVDDAEIERWRRR